MKGNCKRYVDNYIALLYFYVKTTRFEQSEKIEKPRRIAESRLLCVDLSWVFIGKRTFSFLLKAIIFRIKSVVVNVAFYL